MDVVMENWGYSAAVGAGALFLMAVTFFPISILQWLDQKRYLYEVTFALSMLTPTEKFIVNSLVLLITGMLTIAAVLYLPDHVVVVANRLFYYFAGDESGASRIAAVLSSADQSAAAGAG